MISTDNKGTKAIMEFPFGDILRTQIARNLAGFTPVELASDDLRKAAVAIVIVKNLENEGASVLLTLRPRHMNRHGGQFALPGGRMDGDETIVETALRETDEELGLHLTADHVVGRLDDYETRSGFRISPLVVWGGEAPDLSPDPNEVERVYRIPFEELDSSSVPHLSDEPDGRNPVLSALMPSLGGYVYAPTAALLYQFREVAIRGLDTRVAHYEQPEFAWK